MSIDGLNTVAGVADFLEQEVAAAVPGELRSEVRAAAKLLRTSAIELSVRPREVAAEIDDLLRLCGPVADGADADRLVDLAAHARSTRLTLREQEELRIEVNEITARTMTRLAEARDPRLSAFVTCLGTHAARRSSWQAVFPPNPAGVDQ